MYKQGEIVLIPFPFTDFSSNKKRPVLILSNDYYNNLTDDVIAAAITSNTAGKLYSVSLTNDGLTDGTLIYDSLIRADKVYTLSQSVILKRFGSVKKEIFASVIGKINEILIYGSLNGRTIR